MKYQVNMTIEVDEDANFFEFLGDDKTIIQELIAIQLYDLDDIEVIEIEVYE